MITRLGLQRTSLVDFPGRVACVFFLPGCNFRCPWCHNPELVLPRPADSEFIPLGQALGFLDQRKKVLSGVVLSGGEPCTHPELDRLAFAIRARGLAVKLDSNGFFPAAIRAVDPDYLAVDVKGAPEDYPRFAPEGAAERLLESLDLARSRGRPYEIRITAVPGFVGPETIARIATLLDPGDPVVLQPFRPLRTLDPDFASLAPWDAQTMAGLLAALKARAPGARLRGA